MKTMTTAERRHQLYKQAEMAHRRELLRKGFTLDKVGNYGWVGDVNGWASKTSAGILETTRVAPGRYRHTWSN